MPPPFPHVTIIGLGTVGSALAGALARSGRDVVALEADEAALARGRAAVERLGDTGGRIRYSVEPAATASADLVIEAVPERENLKIEVLSRARALCAPGTVFATTTTALSVAALAVASGLPDRLVGVHPVHPGAKGRAVELIRTAETSPEVLRSVGELLASLGDKAVEVDDQPGSLSGVLVIDYLNSAVRLYEQRYATRDDIDAAMTLGCGLPLGPLAQLDAIGLDVAHDTLSVMYRRTGELRLRPARLLTALVSAGRLGRKSGRGFHDYSAVAEPSEAGTGTGAERPDPRGRVVRRVGVVGSGTMAAGIAEVSARAGYPTVVVARSDVRAKEAVASVARSMERAVRKGKLRDLGAMDLITGAAGLEALADCDLVVEAVVEDAAVKHALFAELDRVCRPGTVLATTTSSLSVLECAAATGRAADVLGLHFFNPAPMMRLVELTTTAVTGEDAAATAREWCADLGKHTVACGDRTGFIVNFLLFPYLNRAVRLLDEGRATASAIDSVMESGWGYPAGPLKLLDVIGLDVSLAIQRKLLDAFPEPELEPAPSLERLVGSGALGRKTGRGFHSYARV